jgi:hypothetical protein
MSDIREFDKLWKEIHALKAERDSAIARAEKAEADAAVKTQALQRALMWCVAAGMDGTGDCVEPAWCEDARAAIAAATGGAR